MVDYFLAVSFFVFFYMTVWFLLSLIKKRNDVADVAWGFGFVFVAWFSMFLEQNFTPTSFVACALVTVWGVRLSIHIFIRNKDKREDYRYANWRNQWGKFFYLKSYLQVFLLQGFLLLLIASPVIIVNWREVSDVSFFLFIGAFVWLVGFFFETVGDFQLNQFIKEEKNKGRLMSSGLWKYTRHPNYFGEVVCWWGLWIIALSVPYGALSIIGPVTITLLILKVSGIPMLEKKMEEHPDFNEYKKRVSVFFPYPQKDK